MSHTGEKRQILAFSLSGSLAFGSGVEPVYETPEPYFVPKLKPGDSFKVFLKYQVIFFNV